MTEAVFVKCAWRLIPFMMLIYVVNYLDRVNVGIAALTMNKDLGLTPSVYGFAAGIFYLSYALFQVPANVILDRVGARRQVFCVMIGWGAVSALTAFAQGPLSFYTFRFLLGMWEAGFFPGMILYMTFWFPKAYRARLIAIFMAAAPIANIFGGPLSAFLLDRNGRAGLHGWQWLFLIEGLPACFLAFAVLKFLPDGPASATWLSAQEKEIIATRLAAEKPPGRPDLWSGLFDPRVLLLGLAGIGVGAGVYGGQLWLPQIVQAMGFSHMATGFLVSVAPLLGLPSMVLLGYSSDRRDERVWHCVLPWLVGAAGYTVATLTHNDIIEIAALTIAVASLIAAQGPFYSLASSFLSGPAAAAGIAVVNLLTVGLGGFLGNNLIGFLKQQTGTYNMGLTTLAVGLTAAIAIVLILSRVMRTRTVMTAQYPLP